MDDLLPANATELERALSIAMGPRLTGAALGIRGFKARPNDSVYPWLVWELGLAELLPYIAAPQALITNGVRFQRLRGTPAAMAITLGWIGFDGATVEPEIPDTHWMEFQIDPGRIPTRSEIAAIAAVAKVAAPARSRLSRLYHGLDIRRLILDDDAPDDDGLLDDHSGIYVPGIVPKLSVRRIDSAGSVRAGGAVGAGQRIGFTLWAPWPGAWRIDDDPAPDDAAEVDFAGIGAFTRLGIKTPGLARSGDIWPDAPWPDAPWGGFDLSAGSVASLTRAYCDISDDGQPLDEINARLPGTYWREFGAPPLLDDDAPDDTAWGAEPVVIDRYEIVVDGIGAAFAPAARSARVGARATMGLGVTLRGTFTLTDGVVPDDLPGEPPQIAIAGQTTTGMGARETGRAWASSPWPDSDWATLRFAIIGQTEG